LQQAAVHEVDSESEVAESENSKLVVLTEFFKFATVFKALHPIPRQGRSYIFRFKLDVFMKWDRPGSASTSSLVCRNHFTIINSVFDDKLEYASVLAPLANFDSLFCYIALDFSASTRSPKVQDLLFNFVRKFGFVSEVSGHSLKIPTVFKNYATQASETLGLYRWVCKDYKVPNRRSIAWLNQLAQSENHNQSLAIEVGKNLAVDDVPLSLVFSAQPGLAQHKQIIESTRDAIKTSTHKRYHVQCAVCKVKSSKPFAYESGGVVTRARSFNEELFIDFLHLGSEQLDPVRGVVVLLDAHSRFVRIFPTVTDKPSGKDVANAIASWIADFGSPQAIRVDQGRENYNALVYDLCAKYGTQVRYGPSGHPQAQSLVERFNGTLLKLLRTLSQAEEPISTRLERARYIYLRRVQKGIGCSPIAMLSETVLASSPGESDLTRRVSSCPLSEGDKVLWKRTNHPKDEFGWLEDEVVEILGSRTVRLRSGKVSSLDRLRKL